MSFVIPCFNEEMNVSIIYRELIAVTSAEKFRFEFIFIDDGSTDNTWQEICKLAGSSRKVRGLRFSRNFGHNAALEAGLNDANGDAIIMMDADLQHPPSLIPSMLSAWACGADIVNTTRKSSAGASRFKKFTSRVFYWLLNSLSDLSLEDGQADFRLVSRKVIDIINGLPESPKFYRGLFNWVGFNAESIEYDAQERRTGSSSYSLKKMLELARLGITSFSGKPLKLIFTTGLVLVMLSSTSILTMLGVKLFFNSEFFSYNAILLMFVVFVAGVLTTFQGIIAVYLVDIFTASKSRPTYIVRDLQH